MTNSINNEKMIPAPMFMMLLAFLEKEYQFDSQSFLKKHHISYSMLFDSSFSVPMGLLKEIMSHMLAKEQDYGFLYNLAKLSTPSHLGILGYIMLHSKNVSQALEKLCKYYLIIGKRIQPIFSSCEEGFKIVIVFNNEQGELIDFEEYNVLVHLFAVLHLINHIIPFEIKPKFIHLVQEKPTFELKNDSIVGIPTFFNAQENAIYFDKSLAGIQTVNANEQLLQIFEKEAEESLGIKLNQHSLKDKISSLILISSTELDISLESVAKRANMSPRVLQKRLKFEGTTFSQILQEVRRRLSIYYLSKEMDIHTISLNLGYIDLSSFFRAFKKWYGMTPSDYKKRN